MEIFEKARELANLLLESDEGQKYTSAKYIFDSNLESHQKLNEYNRCRDKFNEKMQLGYESEEEFEKQRKQLNEIATEIKKDKIISDFFKAEKDFNNLVSNVMSLFNSTLNGEMEQEKKGCCSGGCGGCSGCN